MRWKVAALSATIALAMLTATVSGAAAAPPLDLHIEVHEVLGTSGEPFAASGGAVVAGLVCSAGTVDDLSVKVSGPPSGAFSILHVLKRFNCDDLSGSFDVDLVVRLDNVTRFTTARWRISGGTGAYAALHGTGSLAGTPNPPGVAIDDVYDGMAH